MENELYKTLICGKLVQLSGFSTGGNNPNPLVDSCLSLDGAGRPVIRGSSLAGALIAQASQLYQDHSQTAPNKLGSAISEGLPSVDTPVTKKLRESVWRFHHSHLSQQQQPLSEYRSGVAISDRTGAAIEGAKFNIETLPAGSEWDFLLEIDEYLDDQQTALAIALNTLEQWQQGHCWLGRDVARGLGWMKLCQLELYRLKPEDAKLWPNSQLRPQEIIDQHLKHRKVTEYQPLAEPHRPLNKLHRISGTATITINPEPEPGETPWGIELLSVGGESNSAGKMQLDEKNLILASGQTRQSQSDNTEPDKQLAWTDIAPSNNHTLQQGPQPYIPGSSIRGVLRHALQDYQNQLSNTDLLDTVTALFGSLEHSAELLIADGHLCSKDYQAVILEMHAEDEFTASTFAKSKFNCPALIQGEFSFRFSIQANDQDTLARYRHLFQQLEALASYQQLPLGGGQWRGMGWVKWDFNYDKDNSSNHYQQDLSQEATHG